MAAVAKFPPHGTARILLNRGSGLEDDLVSTPSRTFAAPSPRTSWKSIKSMPSDISEYAIDPAIWTDTKEIPTRDDEKLDAFQKTVIALRGDLPQKIYGAKQLKNLVRTNADRTFVELLPLLETELRKSSQVDLHNAAGSSMLGLFRAMIKVRNSARVKQIMDIVKHFLNSCDDPELMAVWLEVMEGIMEQVSPRDIPTHVLPVILEMCETKRASLSKKAAIILARKLLHGISDHRVIMSMWDLQRQLMGEESAAVRAAAITFWPDLAKKVDAEHVGVIVEELIKATEDRDPVVQSAVVDAFGGLMVVVKMEKSAHAAIIPLIRRMLYDSYTHKPPNLTLLVHLAKHVGKIVETCAASGWLSNEEKLWFTDAFVQLSRYELANRLGPGLAFEMPPGLVTFKNKVACGDPPLLSSFGKNSARKSTGKSGNAQQEAPVSNPEIESWMIRAHCAANFPHFATFAKPIIDFQGGVYNVLADIFRDPHPNVRKNIAANLLQVMELAGDEAGLCKDELVKALSDDNVDVIEALVPQLASIMKILVKTQVVSPDNNTAALSEIGGVLLFCEERLSQTRDWRVHSSLLLQLVVLPFCVPCDYIYHNFVPILTHRLLNLNQLPSRLGAAEALVSVLRHSRRAAQRDDIRKKIRGFAHSRKAQDRMLYLYMSNMVMDRFSRKYFREHFFDTTVGLTEDSVSNVRSKTYKMIPKMREKAADDMMAKRLEEVLAKLTKSESDKDALEAINAAAEEIEKLGIQSKKGKDKDDEKKEIEERYVASLESKMVKLEHKKLSAVEHKPAPHIKPPDRHLYAPAVKVTNVAGQEQSRAKVSDTVPPNGNMAGPPKHSPSGFVGFYGGPQDSKNIVPLAKGKSKMLALTPDDSSSRTTPQR